MAIMTNRADLHITVFHLVASAIAVLTAINAMAQTAPSPGLMLAPQPPLLNDRRIIPSFVPDKADLGAAIEVTLAPNEYKPASFVIRSPVAQHGVCVRIGWLSAQDHVIPPSAVDVRWVKCWYQAGGDFSMRDINRSLAPPGRTLLPELLLKNPALVGVV